MELHTDFLQQHHKIPSRKKIFASVLFFVLIIAVCLLILRSTNTSPREFPTHISIEIPEGASQGEVAHILAEKKIIRSPLLLRFQLRLHARDIHVQAGNYIFTHPISSYRVARALIAGEYYTPSLILTLPEGFSVQDIQKYFPEGYHGTFDTIDHAEYEGYLFPDTYYIANTMSVTDILKTLTDTMHEALIPLREQIASSGLTTHGVLTFASILEREANDETSMRRVSGILHNRLSANMPLQVDATLTYFLKKTSAELTIDDLAVDSPYNTYLYKGLPPTPIANPGIMAIDATLNPIKSDDYFYLTGDDGYFYYAKTFEEHVRNKKLYLK